MNSKRRATKDIESKPTKRRQATASTSTSFAAPSEDDLPYASQVNVPLSSAVCTREIKYTLPNLTALCIRAFSSHLEHITREEYMERQILSTLKSLPEPLKERLFSGLKLYCPQRLSHGFVSSVFLDGSTVSLNSELPGIRQLTISALSGNRALRHLTLIGFEQFPDSLFATALHSLLNLQTVNLRGCTKVSSNTAQALSSAQNMTSLNLSYTNVSPQHLAPLVKAWNNLAVLKIANISNCTDKNMTKFMEALGEGFLNPILHTLKLRQNSVSESSLGPLLQVFPNIRRLDVSFTLLHHISKLNIPPLLEKLNLTSTPLEISEFVPQLSKLTRLQILSLGALDSSSGKTASTPFSSNMLYSITDVLETLPLLQNVSLVSNSNLGRFKMVKGQGSALSDFVTRVGRKCTYLNFARVTHLCSADLSGLSSGPDAPEPELQTFILNSTGVDDDAAPFIGSCTHLETLEVAGTKLTRDAVLSIISSCPKLSRLDVTACRGIRLSDRRRVFEISCIYG